MKRLEIPVLTRFLVEHYMFIYLTTSYIGLAEFPLIHDWYSNVRLYI